MKCEEKAIEEICSQLKYHIIYEGCKRDEFCYTFSNETKTHKITHYNKRDGPFWDLCFLHEHVHALHTETLPASFYDNPEIKHIPPDSKEEFIYYFRVARDWYVTGYMMVKCPKKTKKMIQADCVDILNKINEKMPCSDILIAGLCCAQSKKYNGVDIIDQYRISDVANVLLKYPPYEPSEEGLYNIVTELTDSLGYFKIYKECGDNWKVKQTKQLPSSASRSDIFGQLVSH